jgi:DNA topoisomerase-1
LAVDIDNDFKPDYRTIKGREPILKELRDLARKASQTYLASDPDREGEAIASHVAEKIGVDEKRVHRVLLNEITRRGVEEGFRDVQKINRNKVDAQRTRRILDRIVGYYLSPVLWKTISATGRLSAGRVQSVALRLMCEREEIILNFQPDEYWTIHVALVKDSHVFHAKLIRIGKRKASPKKEEEAQQICEAVQGEQFKVLTFVKSETKRHPPPPFITSTLQQEAANRLRFSAERTMRVAQQLYEGIDLKEESVGLITYMRTDSTRVSEEAHQQLRKYIQDEFSSDYLEPNLRVYRPKKRAQGAHEAIRPTSVRRQPQKIKNRLSREQFLLYDLIWRRFVATQMSSMIYAHSRADIEAGEYQFRAVGSRVKLDGFSKVYQLKGKKEETLPELVPGELLTLKSIEPKQHFTEPPPRYTEATLIKELESLGIGRPSTYAPIVSIIKKRGYGVLEKGKFHPTDLGQVVNKVLTSRFSEVINVDFTAQLEAELDLIEEGKRYWVETLRNFYFPFNTLIEEVKENMKAIKEELQTPTGERCKICGKPMVIKWGRYGRFIACSGYPECKNKRALQEEVVDRTCEKCGAQLTVKIGKYGRFLACSRYPECTYTAPLTLGIQCPKCEGEIAERRSRRGRIFYSCSNYPKCDFASWSKPVPQRCPECDAPFLLDKGGHLYCSQCKKKFQKRNPEDKK